MAAAGKRVVCLDGTTLAAAELTAVATFTAVPDVAATLAAMLYLLAGVSAVQVEPSVMLFARLKLSWKSGAMIVTL